MNIVCNKTPRKKAMNIYWAWSGHFLLTFEITSHNQELMNKICIYRTPTIKTVQIAIFSSTWWKPNNHCSKTIYCVLMQLHKIYPQNVYFLTGNIELFTPIMYNLWTTTLINWNLECGFRINNAYSTMQINRTQNT